MADILDELEALAKAGPVGWVFPHQLWPHERQFMKTEPINIDGKQPLLPIDPTTLLALIARVRAAEGAVLDMRERAVTALKKHAAEQWTKDRERNFLAAAEIVRALPTPPETKP